MNKKAILAIIILILIVTGLVFFLKYKGLIGTPKTWLPGQEEAKKKKPETVDVKTANVIGSVVSISDQELVILSGESETRLDITSNPSTYLMEGEKRVDKKASDLKAGSLVKIYYLDNIDKKVPLVILIDKL